MPAISTGLGIWGAHKQAGLYNDYAGQQDQIAKQQGSMARQMLNMGQGQFQMGMPALSKAMQHYMTLATGSRGAINQELAPERAGLTETFSGAQRGMERSMAPGAARDQAIADLARRRSGALGLLPAQARQGAFGQLSAMGGQALDRGGQLFDKSGRLLQEESGTQKQALEGRLGAGNAWQQFGQNMFQTWGPALQGWLSSRGGGAKGPAGSMTGNASGNPWEMMG